MTGDPHTAAPRIYLFLQSHPSFFGRAVIRHMRCQGHRCEVVNVSLGDWFFRFGTGAVNYTGRLEDWPDWLDRFVTERGVTDIIYYADQRPYHRAARQLARRRGIDCYAYEFGYYRPDFITLERGGMGVFSHFPNDPDLIEQLAADLPDGEPKGFFPYTFRDEAVNEVFYHLTPWFLPLLFPRYRRDRMFNPLLEYLSYLPKLFLKARRTRRADSLIAALRKNETPYHVVILQMQGDYQVRRAGHYPNLEAMAEEVLSSFAANAAPDRVLVFKMHPLENALRDWPGIVLRVAARHGLSERVFVIDGGDLGDLYKGASGVVLINSTAALAALQQGLPVKVLGIAVYDIARITHQSTLDTFWETPERPVPETLAAFRKLLIAAVQVKGNFFTPKGRARAVPEFARRLVERDVNGYGAFVDPPPRLARARAMGVPMIYEDDT
ncbi:MAG: capsular biosynthesis protein [Pseudomonadota bacterium]